jgi:hypothetical protein
LPARSSGSNSGRRPPLPGMGCYMVPVSHFGCAAGKHRQVQFDYPTAPTPRAESIDQSHRALQAGAEILSQSAKFMPSRTWSALEPLSTVQHPPRSSYSSLSLFLGSSIPASESMSARAIADCWTCRAGGAVRGIRGPIS